MLSGVAGGRKLNGEQGPRRAAPSVLKGGIHPPIDEFPRLKAVCRLYYGIAMLQLLCLAAA